MSKRATAPKPRTFRLTTMERELLAEILEQRAEDYQEGAESEEWDRKTRAEYAQALTTVRKLQSKLLRPSRGR